MLRKMGLGASDASVYLGTMTAFNKTVDDLITDKLTMKYTDKDREISEKPAVRMGSDLEDMVLQKAEASFGKPIIKAPQMFRMKKFPYLTMNLDGVMAVSNGYVIDPLAQVMYIPVEAKVVTQYGDKYYNWDNASRLLPIEREFNGRPGELADRQGYIGALAEAVGIPAYYYVQVQHELLGMGSVYGHLAALRIKDWQVHIFTVAANRFVQEWLITEGHKVWQRIEKLRGMGQRQ